MPSAEAKQAVVGELNGHIYVCDPEAFLNQFFPPGDKFDTILEGLTNDGHYNESLSKWSSLSQNGRYYDFSNLANAIRRQALNLELTTPESVNSGWVDSDVQFLRSTIAALDRPGVANVIGNKEEWRQLEKLSLRVHSAPDPPQLPLGTGQKRKRQTDASVPKPMPSQEQLRCILASWFRMVVPVEIRTSEDRQGSIVQLLGYMRQILREQQDRRFVFGILIFHRSLSLWYCDRSGVLGTSCLIDIDQNPMCLVRVIANIAIKSPFELGWDPTMRLQVATRPRAFKYSHDSNISSSEMPSSSGDIHWEITIEDELGKMHRYITTKLLSTTRSEVMCGRATLVWLSINVETQKPAVIKHYWRLTDAHVASESYLWGLAAGTGSHHVPKMVLHADVKGNKTVEELRNGVSSTPIGTVFHNQGKVAPGPDEDQHDLYLHAANVELRDLFLSDGLVEFSSFQTTGRCLTRMVFEDFGWPIKFFRNLGELMRTLYGALEGYQVLQDKGIAHRDISCCNIMIRYNPSHTENQKVPDVTQTIGQLIDLEHAKVDPEYTPINLLEDVSTFLILGSTGSLGWPTPNQRLAKLLLHVGKTAAEGGGIGRGGFAEHRGLEPTRGQTCTSSGGCRVHAPPLVYPNE